MKKSPLAIFLLSFLFFFGCAKDDNNTEKELEPIAASTFTVTCLRFATACGFSPRLRLDLVLNDFVASAIAKGSIEILSDGLAWRPLI